MTSRGFGAPFPFGVGCTPGMIALALIRPHNTQREGGVGIFTVVNKAEVYFVLAGKEELMGRWKHGQRAWADIQDRHAIARPQRDRFRIRRSSKIFGLRVLRGVTPYQFGLGRNGKAL